MRQIVITSGSIQGVTDAGDTRTYAITEELEALVSALSTYLDDVPAPKDTMLDYIERTADDETLLEMEDVFEEWDVGRAYKAGRVLRFNGDLWRVGQPHTSQDDWLPPDVPALYVKIAPTGVIPEWRQPQGKHDAYRIGDKVTHKGNVWECTDGSMDEELGVKLNTWEPGVYGWEQID